MTNLTHEPVSHTTLSETYSVCPVCLGRIRAEYIKKGSAVYLSKECARHGRFSCVVSQDASDFESWKTDTYNIKPKMALRRTEKGCPHDCGPCDEHMQTACCVLIDVTYRCDQLCAVCFASSSPENDGELSLNDICKKLDFLAGMSDARKFNIQLSGGEPTVRDDLPEIVKMAKAKGFEYVQLNTNGKRIGTDENYANVLKQAGADAVFMQFDAVSDSVYETLRKEKLLDIKRRAVDNCRKARLPVALVPTIVKGINDNEIGGIIEFMLENIDVIKGIHFQPVSFFGRYPSAFGNNQRFTMFDTINEIEKQSGGTISKKDLFPISTGHNLCCFYASYIREEDGSISCIRRVEKAPGCCDDEPPCCEEASNGCESEPCCPPDIEIISRDRDFVLNKWKMAEEVSGDGFDVFLNNIRKNSFTLTGMAFQDAMTLDTERLRRCRVQVLAKNNTLVPFCAYNLTDLNGNYLNREHA